MNENSINYYTKLYKHDKRQITNKVKKGQRGKNETSTNNLKPSINYQFEKSI